MVLLLRDASALPLTARIARAIRRVLGIDRERRWNTQYAAGKWDRLGDLDEMAHYAVLAGYVTAIKPGGALLDIGCGDGVLLSQLRGVYGAYLGIDFAEPIARAQSRHAATPSVQFAVSDINEFATRDQFDVIVFNESLYYLHEPLRGLQRYAQFLAPDGVLLISMHVTPRTTALWTEIDAAFCVVDAVTVTNTRGTQWVVKALARRAV